MTRHKESVVIQASQAALHPIIEALKQAGVNHTVTPLEGIVELLIPLKEKKAYETFEKLIPELPGDYLYLDYTHAQLSERWRRKGFSHHELKDKGDSGSVHTRVLQHFNTLLEPLNLPEAFYNTPLYYDMCYYIMEDYITQASKYIYHSPHLVSTDYVQLIQSMDEKTLLKYKSYRLHVLEDLNLI